MKPGHVDWSDLEEKEIVLFSRGSTLKDVPPDFHGMPLKQYLIERVRDLARETLATMPKNDPLAGKRISGPRDNYGWRSL